MDELQRLEVAAEKAQQQASCAVADMVAGRITLAEAEDFFRAFAAAKMESEMFRAKAKCDALLAKHLAALRGMAHGVAAHEVTTNQEGKGKWN